MIHFYIQSLIDNKLFYVEVVARVSIFHFMTKKLYPTQSLMQISRIAKLKRNKSCWSKQVVQ